MNHSMLTCGRTTHLKIVAVALIAAVLFATVGLKARLDDSGAGNVTANLKAGGPRRESRQARALFDPRRRCHALTRFVSAIRFGR